MQPVVKTILALSLLQRDQPNCIEMIRLKVGDVLQGRYRIIKLLGAGGFGAVYLAEHVRLQGRLIALKVSFDNSKDAEKQFLFEASTLASLRHHALPTVSDSFVEPGGQLFLVMDYIEGQDLTDVIMQSNGPLTETKALEWLIQVSEAVAHLHEQPQPIIHRDIKPPNIKITPDGKAVLVDFGIAKQFMPGKRTAKIAKAFSPGFSPKEQYIGTTDTRADVYALGATLYCLLTATVPPDAFEERYMGQVMLPPPRKLNPRITPQTEQVIMRAMALEARYRYDNGRDLLQALRACQVGQVGASGTRCPRCGQINRPRVRFCVRDGTPLVAAAPTPQRAAPVHYSPPMKGPSSVDVAAAKKHNAQGLTYSKANQHNLAVGEYEQAVQLDGQNAVYHHNLAVAYRSANRLHEALPMAKQAETLDPRDADYPALVGRISRDLKQFTMAIAAYRRAIRLETQNDALYGELGDVYLLAGDPIEAMNAFLEAAKLQPNNPRYLMRLAHLLYQADLLDEAEQLTRDAVRLAPDSDIIHNLLGMILFNKGDYRGALKAQEEAFRLNPNEASYALNIAMDHLALGQKSKARQMAQKAVMLDQGNAKAKELLRQI
jgi:tetratricopeptide (TPR) repeat protein